jgi:hypothetical protein
MCEKARREGSRWVAYAKCLRVRNSEMAKLIFCRIRPTCLAQKIPPAPAFAPFAFAYSARIHPTYESVANSGRRWQSSFKCGNCCA